MNDPGDVSIEETFRSIVASRKDIRAALVFGSKARADPPADIWSDLDLMAFVTTPEAFVADQSWLKYMGKTAIAFAQLNIFGRGVEVRILFPRGQDVEFLFFPYEQMTELLIRKEISDWIRPGYRVLIDKDGRLDELLRVSSYREPAAPFSVSTGEYRNLIADFFFHVVWTTKKLLRGETLTAKVCCDVYMKHLLLQLLVWDTRLRNGESEMLIYGERFFETWADDRVVREFSEIYARYDAKDIIRALDRTARLFSRIAIETGSRLGYDYPSEYEERAMRLKRRFTESGE